MSSPLSSVPLRGVGWGTAQACADPRNARSSPLQCEGRFWGHQPSLCGAAGHSWGPAPCRLWLRARVVLVAPCSRGSRSSGRSNKAAPGSSKRVTSCRLLRLPSPLVNDLLALFPNTPKIDFPGSSPRSEPFRGTAARRHAAAGSCSRASLVETKPVSVVHCPNRACPFPPTHPNRPGGLLAWLASPLLPPRCRTRALGRALPGLLGHHAVSHQHRDGEDHLQPPAAAHPALRLQPARQQEAQAEEQRAHRWVRKAPASPGRARLL